MTLYERIAHASTFCGCFMMPFKRGDLAREKELHQAGRSLGLVTKSVAPESSRYGAVMMSSHQQPELL